MSKEQVKIIFFDGVCVLCNGFADFILKYDRNKTLKLASLQGTKAQILLPTEDLIELNSILYYVDGQLYRSTDAVLKILAELGGGWKLLSYLKIIPRFIREPIYFFIAKNRYRFFGKNESCRLPTPEERQRFFD